MHLAALQSSSGMFSLLSFDQIVAFADQLGLGLQRSEDAQLIECLLEKAVKAYSPSVSGILLAPEFGYDALTQKAPQAGVAFPLEKRLFDADPLSIPILHPQWGVEAIRNNYGVAKLELFYHPEEHEAATKKQMVAELYDYCQHENIDLILELLIFMEGTEEEYQTQFPELQLTAIQEFRSICSLMALEYPLNALGAVTVTAELDIPWVLSGRNTAYDVFKEQLRTVLESGASGFMAMEQFLPTQKDKQPISQEMFDQFLQTIGRDRILEVKRISEEHSKHLPL